MTALAGTVLVLFSGAALLLGQRKKCLTFLPAETAPQEHSGKAYLTYDGECGGWVCSMGATSRAGKSYAWMWGSEAFLKISNLPSGLSLW